MLKKMPLRNLIHVLITGESITNKNNSTDILKIRNLFCTCLLGPGKVGRRKNGYEKSRDTVPLSLTSDVWCISRYKETILGDV
jgi:hypothetical protein